MGSLRKDIQDKYLEELKKQYTVINYNGTYGSDGVDKLCHLIKNHKGNKDGAYVLIYNKVLSDGTKVTNIMISNEEYGYSVPSFCPVLGELVASVQLDHILSVFDIEQTDHSIAINYLANHPAALGNMLNNVLNMQKEIIDYQYNEITKADFWISSIYPQIKAKYKKLFGKVFELPKKLFPRVDAMKNEK